MLRGKVIDFFLKFQRLKTIIKLIRINYTYQSLQNKSKLFIS